MLVNLDLWILDRVFNPLSIKLYKLFGLNNFTAAKLLMMVGTSALLLTAYLLVTGQATSNIPYLLAGVCIIDFASVSVCIVSAIKQEGRWNSLSANALPENMRDAPRWEVSIRKLFLEFLVLAGPLVLLLVFYQSLGRIYLLRSAAWAVLLAGLYFLACTPPDFRSRREREEADRQLQAATSKG